MDESGGWTQGDPREIVVDADRALMKMHIALRPAWACMGCADPWPCLVARVTLTDELGSNLRSAMSAYATEAHRDLVPPLSIAGLADRFLGWVRREVE